MSGNDSDMRIDAWLREELDAVPKPTRALQSAVDAAAITPQRRGRLLWLRQLLGLDTSTEQHGHRDRPEVVLTPAGHARDGGAGVLRREGVVSLSTVMAILLVAIVLVGAATWMTVGPGRELIGGSGTEGTVAPEAPRQPLDPPGPDRVIVVDPTEGHFGTIAGAMAAAVSGDSIELRPGTYAADVIIDKDITIVGVGDREAIVVTSEPLPEGEPDRLRSVFTFQDSDASLSGITVRGSDFGTAIRINGGSPTLDDLLIDSDGDMRRSSPSRPREALEVSDGANATIRDTDTTSLSSVMGGASATIEGGSMRSGCLLVEDQGTSAIVRGVLFEASECPGFSVSVADGAHVLLEAATIESPDGNTGIRVANDGSTAEITGSAISGGAQGLYVGDGAEVTFYRSNVLGADTGVHVSDAALMLELGALLDNGVGLSVRGDSFVETSNTDICENGQNLDLRDGAAVPLDLNRVCLDGTKEIAVETGT